MEIKRKLASIRKIADVQPIPDADRIVCYQVDGWKVVDSKDKYQVGDLVVYIECDAWVSTELAPFLSKGKEPRVYKGISGERLRIQKFKKQISQGLLLATHNLKGYEKTVAMVADKEGVSLPCIEGEDVTDMLGIVQWESEPEFRSADAKGTFPSFIPKTDQPRVQNIVKELSNDFENHEWLIEEKLDGSSFTCYLNGGEFGVCSRNLELKDSGNTFWNTAKAYNLEEKLKDIGQNIAIQCELIGSGIQGNRYGISGYELRLFDIFDINKQEYLNSENRNEVAKSLGIPIVPIISTYRGVFNLEQMLTESDGKSKINGCVREGFVWRKSGNSRFTFKVISNSYLLGEK